MLWNASLTALDLSRTKLCEKSKRASNKYILSPLPISMMQLVLHFLLILWCQIKLSNFPCSFHGRLDKPFYVKICIYSVNVADDFFLF